MESSVRISLGLLSEAECSEVFYFTTLELCFFSFGDYTQDLISRYSLDTTRLICDVNSRRSLGIPDNVVRQNGNPRQSKVLKKSGKTSLYMTRPIRDIVRRNRQLLKLASELYGTEKLAFTQGLDHIIYKSYLSDASLPTLDCKIMEPLQPMTSNTNPYHYVILVCLSKDSNPTCDENADLKLLLGFERYYDEILGLISQSGIFPIAKQKKNVNFSLLEGFQLDKINDELEKIHANDPVPFRKLEWKTIDMNPGDVVMFDCRIPYMTDRNKCNVPSMYMIYSMRPVGSAFYGSDNHKMLVESVTKAKIGNWKKKTFKNANREEYMWRAGFKNFPLSTIDACIDIKDFDSIDRLIFGLDKYAGI